MPTVSPPACYSSYLVNQGLNAGASSRTTLYCLQGLGGGTASVDPGVNGSNQPYLSNQCWQWSGTNWSNISSASSASPFIDTNGVLPLRKGMALGFDGTNIICYGGEGQSSTDGILQDTWSFTGSTNTWAKASSTLTATSPYGRTDALMASLCTATVTGTAAPVSMTYSGIAMYSGKSTWYNLQEMWNWTHSAGWSQTTYTNTVSNPAPAARTRTTFVADNAGNAWLFGGKGTTQLFNDMWKWNGTTFAQQTLTGATISARYGHSMAYDFTSGNFILFGGASYDAVLPPQTFTSSNGTSWTQQSPTNSPMGLVGAQMAYDSATTVGSGHTGCVILFGGRSYAGSNNLTWGYDAVGNSWYQL